MHSAIKSGGCVTCHEIKTENDQTTITLLASGNALCLMCHEDKGSTGAKGLVHQPVAEGECTTCHSPHASPNEFQLVQSPSGAKDENLCLMCHNIASQAPPNGSRHAALDMGCDTCHLTHKTGPAEKKEFAYHLNQTIPALCVNCHDVSAKSIVTAHRGQPILESNCVSCHDPHVSDRPKLLYKFSHSPFTEGQCGSCHEAAKGNKVMVLENGQRALCAMCHDDIEKKAASSPYPHGVFKKSNTCTVCHDPHTTAFPWHLNRAPGLICENCHKPWMEERAKKKFTHDPVFKGDCNICHEPHGSSFPKHLRAEVNDLCLTCHARDAQGESGSNAERLILFGGAVQVPGNYLAQLTHITVPRGGTKGHPHFNHPVGGVRDPADPQRKMSCISCHDPHAGNGNVRRFVTETKSSSPLCIHCHK